MYAVCGLKLGPNLGVQLTAEKNNLRLTVEKIRTSGKWDSFQPKTFKNPKYHTLKKFPVFF